MANTEKITQIFEKVRDYLRVCAPKRVRVSICSGFTRARQVVLIFIFIMGAEKDQD